MHTIHAPIQDMNKAPPIPLTPVGQYIRIFLLDSKGGIRNVS